MAGAGTAFQVVGAGVSAYGDIVAGEDEASADQYNAYIANNNALIARQQGAYNAARQQGVSQRSIAKTTTAYAASGVATNTGSAAAVIGASAANAELDRQNIVHGADIRATAYTNQANMEIYQGQSAILNSHFKAIGALTGGATDILKQNTSAGSPGDVPLGNAGDSVADGGGGMSASAY